MAPAPRKLILGGREYRVLPPSLRDPRLHVAAVLLTLQVLGQTVLNFRLSVAQILVCLATGALIEFAYEFINNKAIMWPASGMLTGNSTAFILRTPGTYHGEWWSLNGIWIFFAVVAVAMASKYIVRWRGRHIFNPSNFALVLAFAALGPRLTEPQDLWWIPMGPWMIVTYAILVGGGLFIAWELKLLGLELGYMAAFAVFAALALLPVRDHCMTASWYATPMCGPRLWQILVTSPELLVFAFFMVPDPRTVPEGQLSRLIFGIVVAFLSVLLIGPTVLEFWTKTAILASLVFACAGRFALVRLLESLREVRWALPVAAGTSVALLASLPASAATSPRATALDVARPPSGTASAQPADGLLLPPIPRVTVPDSVLAFDDRMTPALAQSWARDAVLDLVIESEARRKHDSSLAAAGASGDALESFTDAITADAAASKFVQVTYGFDRVQLTLFLPRLSTQGQRLVGVTLHGTTTIVTRDASGKVLSTQVMPYDRSWGLGGAGTHLVLVNDYTDLKLA